MAKPSLPQSTSAPVQTMQAAPGPIFLPGFQFRFLEIGNGDRLAVVPVAEIEQMAGQNQLFQGNLIDTQAIGIRNAGVHRDGCRSVPA